MKKGAIAALTIIFILAFTGQGIAQLSAPIFADKESADEKIMFIKSGAIVYNYKWTAVKENKNGKTIVTITGYGDNNLQGPERIEWKETSVMQILDNGLRTLSWKKDSSGAEQESWTLKYNWVERKVDYKFTDRASGKSKTKVISLADNALAGDSMFFALRGFPFEKGKGTKIVGKIVDQNGGVIEGAMISHGEEKLSTDFGYIDTYKLELKPTGIIGVVAPKMWIWYTKAKPHIMLRFDGRDAGLTSPRTKKVKVKYEPASAIK